MANIASQAKPGFGAYFHISNGDSPETFEILAEVKGIPGIGAMQLVEDVTHMASPQGWIERIGLTLKDSKPFTLPLNFVADNTHQVQLFQTEIGNTTKKNWKISFTDDSDTYIIFEAIVTEFTITHEVKGVANAEVTFTPSGPFTWGTA